MRISQSFLRGFVFGALPALLLSTGCDDPSVTLPDGARPNTDLGEDLTGAPARWYGQPEPGALLYAESKLDPLDRWREWKRDPHSVRHGGMQHLFFAGSPAPPNSQERWTIGKVSVNEAQMLPNPPLSYSQVLATGAPGTWDAGDLTSPTVLAGSPLANSGFALFYSATGDPQKPDYVQQIGFAVSADGAKWERRLGPVISAPAFSQGEPTQMGPESHGVSEPAALALGGNTVWLYYAALSCSPTCRFEIRRAVTTDGIGFREAVTVLKGRDGIPEEAGGVAGPSVVLKDGVFYLAYSQVKEVPQKTKASLRRALLGGSIALATSTDGKVFASASGKGPLFTGPQSYFAGGTSGPALEIPSQGAQGDLRLYFGGVTELAMPAFSLGRATLRR